MAESPFRHELETQIEPIKGLLLGLFFVGVGMSADLRLLFGMPLLVLALTLLLVVIKLPLLYGWGAWPVGSTSPEALCTGVVLASGGEFAFVVFKLALDHQVLAQQVHDLLVLAITLSMAVVPLVMMAPRDSCVTTAQPVQALKRATESRHMAHLSSEVKHATGSQAGQPPVAGLARCAHQGRPGGGAGDVRLPDVPAVLELMLWSVIWR